MPAPAGLRSLEHGGPDDEREVERVDVAAGGEEREVEARDDEHRGDDADERGERGPAQRVEPEDERDEARDA